MSWAARLYFIILVICITSGEHSDEESEEKISNYWKNFHNITNSSILSTPLLRIEAKGNYFGAKNQLTNESIVAQTQNAKSEKSSFDGDGFDAEGTMSDTLKSEEPIITEIRAFVDNQPAWTSLTDKKGQEAPNKGSAIAEPFHNFLTRENSDLSKDLKLENTDLKIKKEKELNNMFDWKTNYQSGTKLEDSSNEFGTPASNSLPFTKSSFRSAVSQITLPVHDQGLPGGQNEEESPIDISFLQIPPDEKSIGNPKIDFQPLPSEESYEMATLSRTDGTFLFSYLGDFLSFIQPYDFPVEILRDALWSRLSIVNLIFQSLRAEAGFVTCVTVGVLLSFVIPSLTAAASCSTICLPAKQVSNSASVSTNQSINCMRKTLLFVLFLLILAIGAGVTALVVTNEQFSTSLLQTPEVMSVALNDLNSYIRDSQRQLSHVTVTAAEKLTNVLLADLDGVEELLGKPIQKQVASDTGVDVALETLVDIATVLTGLSKKVMELEETNMKLRELAMEAKDRLSDVRAQVEGLRRACPSRDRPLCETIEPYGLEISIRTDWINMDPRLAMLRSLAEGSLSLQAKKVKTRFEEIPLSIAKATKIVREEIKREVQQQKIDIDASMWPIESLSRDLRSKVNEAKEIIASVEQAVVDLEQWRWLSMLAAAVLLMVIWILFVAALIYSCCDRDGKSKSLLIGALVTASLLSMIMWAIALALFLVGGHGEVFICRPLYDSPSYKSLTELVDDPGIIYQRGGGLFRNILNRNQSLNVPVKTILQECEENKSVYEAFRLKNMLNIDAFSDIRSWDKVFNNLHNLKINYSQLEFLDPELQDSLQTLLQATGVNMTMMRSQMSKPVTGKDLVSFAKQLDSVANQIKDLGTSSRVETLASRTRRVINTNIQPLEEKKEQLVYQMIAIEVQILPLQRQVNQSLSHLKTIQYYINNQESNIYEMKVTEYTRRLKSYMGQFQDQLVSALSNSVALCRPVFDVFFGIRHHMCRQIMDPLNGFWFALVWSMLSLIMATPISINLIHYFGRYKEAIFDSNSTAGSTGRSAVWTTPGETESMEENW